MRRFRSRAELERWQDARARRHIAWVIDHSAFYRKLYAGRALAEWRSFPTIDKHAMMESFDEVNTAHLSRARAEAVALRAEETRDFEPEIGELTVGLSSGTSGRRGLFVASRAERWKYAGTILARVLPRPLWARQRIALFLRANSNLYTSTRSSRIAFHYFDLMRPMEEHFDRLRELAPTLLIAPASVLRFLADARVQGHLILAPEKIVSVAEVLDPLDESRISAAFGQKVHQIYQATEGLLGVTCPEGTLHLCEDHVVIQRDDEDRGRFSPIVTDLFRTTQPIIRYRLDDLLQERLDPCPCGSALAAIARIEGRTGDTLELLGAEGQVVPAFPDVITRAILLAGDEIDAYRVLQPARGKLLVSLSTGNAERAAVEDAVRRRLHDMALKLRALPPAVEFAELVERPGPQKLRRVQRLDLPHAAPRPPVPPAAEAK
jgi:putative adenylate-forming enzyme